MVNLSLKVNNKHIGLDLSRPFAAVSRRQLCTQSDLTDAGYLQRGRSRGKSQIALHMGEKR